MKEIGGERGGCSRFDYAPPQSRILYRCPIPNCGKKPDGSGPRGVPLNPNGVGRALKRHIDFAHTDLTQDIEVRVERFNRRSQDLFIPCPSKPPQQRRGTYGMSSQDSHSQGTQQPLSSQEASKHLSSQPEDSGAPNPKNDQKPTHSQKRSIANLDSPSSPPPTKRARQSPQTSPYLPSPKPAPNVPRKRVAPDVASHQSNPAPTTSTWPFPQKRTRIPSRPPLEIAPETGTKDASKHSEATHAPQSENSPTPPQAVKVLSQSHPYPLKEPADAGAQTLLPAPPKMTSAHTAKSPVLTEYLAAYLSQPATQAPNSEMRSNMGQEGSPSPQPEDHLPEGNDGIVDPPPDDTADPTDVPQMDEALSETPYEDSSFLPDRRQDTHLAALPQPSNAPMSDADEEADVSKSIIDPLESLRPPDSPTTEQRVHADLLRDEELPTNNDLMPMSTEGQADAQSSEISCTKPTSS